MDVQYSCGDQKRCWTEVDLTQLRSNLDLYVGALRGSARIMAVVKADAYGHGDVRVARELAKCGIRLFAVSNVDEAVGLRKSGIEGGILVLGYVDVRQASIMSEFDLTQAIVSEEHAAALAKTRLPIKCQFAIDTGMNRIGLDGDDVESCARIIREYSGRLRVNGMFTHLCAADTGRSDCIEFTRGQIAKFAAVADCVADLGLEYVHCCNSAAGLSYLEDNPQFARIGGIVRLGIILYGLKPDSAFALPAGIKPALTWKSIVSQVKDVLPSETIGYGRTFLASHHLRVATVTTGYADGFNRNLSNRGCVLVNGRRAPIVGRVCMDQLMIDVTGIPDVSMGTEVVLLGRSGNLVYTADDMATDLGTIGYEIVCGISKRVQRFYVN